MTLYEQNIYNFILYKKGGNLNCGETAKNIRR